MGIFTLEQVEYALRQLIAADVDYDIHKNLESDEETGEDHYPQLALNFFEYAEQVEDDE